MNKTGFGLLHPPVKMGRGPNAVDLELLCQMVDAFLARGGTFFDTAYTYLDGAAETALRECLVKRHPRDSFFLSNKLPGWYAHSTADNERFYRESLKRCGANRFDAYLVHWINDETYEVAKRFRQFEFTQSLKEAGEVRKTGFSFHDSPTTLERVLSEHPEIDYVMLQVNYLDWENEAIQARRCVEVCEKHGKPVLAMESIKGGTLVNLPQAALAELARLDASLTPAQWALRFVQSIDQIEVSLSGMSTLLIISA